MSPAALDLDALVEQWTLDGHRPLGKGLPDKTLDDQPFKELLLQLEFSSASFFSRFIPALFPPHTPNFLDRLLKWLSNEGLTPDEQRLLFEFAARIAYFSFEDFLQLYRTAFVGQVARWIVDEMNLSLVDPTFADRIDEERRRHTWYCPVTDSMVISEFYHANGITGIDQRPPFRPLHEFSAPKKVKEYMRQHQLTRLVLMEDFVCTGTQTCAVLDWVVKKLKCPVLFLPLVVCPDGIRALAQLAESHPRRLRVEPILPLDDSVFIRPEGGTQDPLFKRIGALASALHHRIADIPDTSCGPFGFSARGNKTTGATVVLFSNTPDNTLPLIHHHARHPSKWQSLFPRVSRETL